MLISSAHAAHAHSVTLCAWQALEGGIAMFLVTSSIVINVPTRGLLAVEAKSSFVFMVGTFE